MSLKVSLCLSLVVCWASTLRLSAVCFLCVWLSVFGVCLLGAGRKGVTALIPRSMNRGTGCLFVCVYVCLSGVPVCLPGDAQMVTRQRLLSKKSEHPCLSSEGAGNCFFTEQHWEWELTALLELWRLPQQPPPPSSGWEIQS